MASPKPDPTGVWQFCMFPPFPCFFYGLIGEGGDCGCWWYLELADVRSTSSEEPQYSPHGGASQLSWVGG
jgi:hypothetical protein